jgi:MFS family permease
MAIGRMIGPVRLGRTSALLPGSVVAAAGAVLVCSTNSPALVTIGLGLAGLGVATLYPITVADLIGTPGARPAHLASLSAFASGIAILVAPAVLAALANVVDLRTAFLITLPLLAILLAVRVRESSADAIAQVGGFPPPDDVDGLQLDVLGAEVFEEPAPRTEQDRDQVDLDLVEEPRLETT